MTQYKPVVGVSEAVTLLFIFLSSKVFLTHVVFLYHEGLNAAWMIPIIQTSTGLLGLLLLVSVLNKFPGRDLVEIGEELTGPYINLLFALYYLAVFVFGAGMTLRGISEQVVAGFLPDTPISLVVFTFVLGTVVVSYLGVEAVARTARFLLGVMVVTAMALVLLTIPLWQFDAFYPLWGGGLWKLLAGALKNTGDFVQILLLGIIYPFLPVNQVRQIGVRGVIVAGFFLFLYVLAPLLIFTYPSATELTLPSFEMARIINIGRFGQRMEVVFLPVWVFGNMIFLSISLYAGAAVLARLCRLSDYRPFVLSVAVFTTVVAFVPRNALQAAYWNHQYLSQYSFIILAAILVILLLTARAKGKGGDKNEQGG
ncbi:GerAB/ArcD/ProY family transporter [Desulfallas sp. Bu1-1]|uniref:GerAB/ArcD/ProY family transporter n=1 Tax=Desulfallas sp. Bu1-1 TaxID=2787620 RepID=UPI0018A11265|nr:GerAB/ArcD/ProY family transporter [Desulfallas sp. Bu1-1]MBF7083751.1 GerAB/ArcD/ProY family transporter [Desulfallas sp. Bu1-1]